MAHGDGSLRKRKGKWQFRIRSQKLGRYITVTGDTQTEARQLGRAKLAQLEQGQSIDAERLTVSDWYAQFIERHRSTWRPTTLQNHVMVRKRYVRPHDLGRMKLAQVQRIHVERWLAWVQAHAAVTKAAGQYLKTLNGVFKDAVRHELLVKDPCQFVAAPLVEKLVVRPPAMGDVDKLCRAAHAEGRYEVLLALHTGLRVGEVNGLCWSDIDFDKAMMHVHRQADQWPKRGWASLKTKSSVRTLPLDTTTLELLQTVKARQAERRMRLGSTWIDHGLVFPNPTGDFATRSGYSRIMQRLCRNAGIERLRFHDLRHWYASIAISRGAPLTLVSRTLGHASVSITADTYGHLEHDSMHVVTTVVGDAIRQAHQSAVIAAS